MNALPRELICIWHWAEALRFPKVSKHLWPGKPKRHGEEWSIAVNAALAKLVKFGKTPVSLQGGFGYWIESPDAGPEGWRFRLQANIVLPK